MISLGVASCTEGASVLVSLEDPGGFGASAVTLAVGRTLEGLSESRRIGSHGFPVSFVVTGAPGAVVDVFAEVRDAQGVVLGRAYSALMLEARKGATVSLILQHPCSSGVECDDGSFCNGKETECTKGLCVAGTPPCSPSLPCQIVAGCNELEDACIFGDAPEVDDGDPCTDDVCTASGPRHTSTVDDGDPCTDDVCTASGPKHTWNVLDDADPCTDDVCTPEGPRHIERPENCGMVSVPAGNFWMGCAPEDSACLENERPRRNVYLSAFAIDSTEVTQQAYEACVNDGKCDEPRCAWDPSTFSDFPVVCVDWLSAKTYCEWLHKRLPTEAEWEKAARGTDGRIYPWGDEPPTCALANHFLCGANLMVAGGQDRTSGASPYGALDMAGNAWEWVADWYGPYDGSALTNPTGPMSGPYHVARGGFCETGFDDIRASARGNNAIGNRYCLVGFRCAR